MNSCKCFENNLLSIAGRSEESGCSCFTKMPTPAIKTTFLEKELQSPISTSKTTKKMQLKDQKDDEVVIKKKKKAWSISVFDIGPLLGEGRFGKVFLARMKESHATVALKILFKSEIWDMKLQVLREIEIQRRLRHPNVLRIYGCFEDDKKVFVVLEHAKQGTLYKLLQKQVRFDEITAAKCMKGLTNALIYCHSNDVIHRDIKPENLLMGNNLEVKLCGFGWSEHIPSSPSTTFARSIEYLSPEMIKGVSHNKSLDIWSVGVLCYELLVGVPPFDAKDDEVYRKIRNVQIKYSEFVSENARDLIAKLLVVKPEGRLPLKNILEHPWILVNTSEGALQPVSVDEKA